MDALEKLKILAKMETPEDIKEFELLSWKLAQTREPDVLSQLISLFDDNNPYQEIMFGLLHIIETYPNEAYVKAVLRSLKTGLISHPEWTDRMVNRIFNEEDCRNIFHQNLHLADKQTLLQLFDLMEKESPHHKKLITELRGELTNEP